MRENKKKNSKAIPATESTLQPIPSNRYWLPYAVIMLLTFLLYANTLKHQYALDDAIVITKNQYTQLAKKDLGESLSKIFSTEAFEGFFGRKTNLVEGGRYRPLSIATFAIELSFFGEAPGISHFFNLLLYGLCGVMLFALLRMLIPEKNPDKWWMGIPFVITALFLLHPIHTEVVANIKGRDELMALFFLFGGMIAVLRYVDRGPAYWLPIAGIAFFLSLLAKETAIPFVLLMPLTVWFFRKPSIPTSLLAAAPFLLSAIVYLALRFSILGFESIGTASTNTEILNDPFLNATAGERLATVVETFGIYLVKLLFPIKLSHDYYFNEIPVTNWSNPIVLASLLANLALLGTGIWLFFKRNIIGFGIIFYFISFSITSNVLVSIGTTMGERFVFIPSLGFLIALVYGIQMLWKKFAPQQQVAKASLAALLLFGVPYGIRTIARNPVWENNLSLFVTDAENSPNSAKVQTSAGGVLVETAIEEVNQLKKTQMLKDGLIHLDKATEIYPDHGQAYVLKGLAYFHLGDYPASLKASETALNKRPLLWQAYSNARATALKMKRYDIVSIFFRLQIDRQAAKGMDPDPNLAFERALNYEEWQKGDSAVWAYGEVLKIDPKMAKAYGQMGRVYGMQLANYDMAIQSGEKAIALDSKLDWVYENVGISYAMKGDPASAIATFNRGLEANPNAAKLYLNRAITYQGAGDQANAQNDFAKAFQLDPSLKPK